MSEEYAQQLVAYVASLGDFEIYTTIDGAYNHIGATVADAVLQANNRYTTHVKPRIASILTRFPDARTTSSALQFVRSESAIEYLSWKGQDRATRFVRILELFASEGVENEAELRTWLEDPATNGKLREVNGVGPKTADYFKILVGMAESAIDRHLSGFLTLAGIPPAAYRQEQTTINAAADLLRIDRAMFDHSIWQYMSQRSRESVQRATAQEPVIP